MLIFLKYYWKQIFLVLAIAAVLGTAYKVVYDRGYKDADTHWQEIQASQEAFRDKQIESIRQLSVTGIEQTLLNNATLAKEIRLLAQTNKPLTSVPCEPTPDFIGAYNAVLKGKK